MTTTQIKKARDKVLRRQAILMEAVEEYTSIVDEALKEAEADAQSRPLKVVEIARLMEKNPSTVWRMGANQCATYAELWRWVKANRPEMLRTIEKNYKNLK